MYQVSNLGRIKNLKSNKILKCNCSKYSYQYVQLHNDNGWKQFSVHRLVAETFIENPNNFPIVNHKDSDKHNNFVDNLEWCTHSYNTVCWWEVYKNERK